MVLPVTILNSGDILRPILAISWANFLSRMEGLRTSSPRMCCKNVQLSIQGAMYKTRSSHCTFLSTLNIYAHSRALESAFVLVPKHLHNNADYRQICNISGIMCAYSTMTIHYSAHACACRRERILDASL